jgi:hypothetical protein
MVEQKGDIQPNQEQIPEPTRRRGKGLVRGVLAAGSAVVLTGALTVLGETTAEASTPASGPTGTTSETTSLNGMDSDCPSDAVCVWVDSQTPGWTNTGVRLSSYAHARLEYVEGGIAVGHGGLPATDANGVTWGLDREIGWQQRCKVDPNATYGRLLYREEDYYGPYSKQGIAGNHTEIDNGPDTTFLYLTENDADICRVDNPRGGYKIAIFTSYGSGGSDGVG